MQSVKTHVENAPDKYANLLPNEKEFINLINKLTTYSILTDKKYGVLRRAGNRLSIELKRRFELLKMVTDKY